MNSCGTFGKELLDSAVSSFKSGFNIENSTTNYKKISDNASWVYLATNKNKPVVYVGNISGYDDQRYLSISNILYTDNNNIRHEIYSDNFTDKNEALAQKAKENLVRSLIESKRVQVTEFEDRANFIINGVYKHGLTSEEVIKNKTYYGITSHQALYLDIYHCLVINIANQSKINFLTSHREYKPEGESIDSYNNYNKFLEYLSSSARFLDLVNYLFPLKADILSINKQDKKGTKAQEVTINVGSNDGVKPKMKFLIYTEIDIVGESTIKDVGEIEVTSVNSNFALCKVKKGGEYILKDDVFIISYFEKPYKFSVYDLYK